MCIKTQSWKYLNEFSDKVLRSGGRQDDQSRSDKQLLVFDAFERMSGYTYFGVIDHDEFLIPSRNRSLKQLLVGLNLMCIRQVKNI